MNDLECSLAFSASDDELDHIKNLDAKYLPKISVVIPSYNQVQFLPETLDSVLAQNYPKLEIFVADGGSTDGSIDVLERYFVKYPGVVRYDSKPDGGHFPGVNKGIANTDGDIIAWINSDDLYLPNTFWKVATFFHFNRCAFIVYGRNRYVTSRLDLVTDYPVDWSPLLSEQRRRMMHFCLVPQPSLFFRRTAVTLCGALASKILDYELWMRWQQDLPFYFYDDYFSLSRLHDQAITANADTKLLSGICETVHQYYGIVPYSWAFKYAYTKVFGAAWARGDHPVVTLKIKLLAHIYWVYMNILWLPRSAARLGKRFINLSRQACRISA